MSNATIERAVIGALVAQPGHRPKILNILQANDFQVQSYQELFIIMSSYFQQGQAFDINILSRALAIGQGNQDVEGLQRQIQEATCELTPEVIAKQAGILIDDGKKRKLQAVASRMSDVDGRPVDETIHKLQNELQTLEARGTGGFQFETMQDIGVKAAMYLDYRSQHIGELTGLPYGITELDEITQGAQDSEMIVIAGRPSMGKSALCFNILPSMCSRRTGLLFSAEMPSRMVYFRMASQLGKVNLRNIVTGDMTDMEWARYTTAMGKLTELSLLVDDTPNIDYREMINRAREAKRRNSIGFIVIDYLQLLSGHSGDDKGITEVSSSLKELARELKIPVVVLSQLNRELERRPDKRPIAADLRGSGSIEQDADVLAMLYRHVVYKPKCRTPNHAEIIIRKQRNGPIGTVNATFDAEFAAFSSWQGGNADTSDGHVKEKKQEFGGFKYSSKKSAYHKD